MNRLVSFVDKTTVIRNIKLKKELEAERENKKS